MSADDVRNPELFPYAFHRTLQFISIMKADAGTITIETYQTLKQAEKARRQFRAFRASLRARPFHPLHKVELGVTINIKIESRTFEEAVLIGVWKRQPRTPRSREGSEELIRNMQVL